MKKSISVVIMVLVAVTSYAQNRQHAANFPLFRQYYNPALTGFAGSVVTSYYRNQWAGFDGAPKTFFLSGEVNLADYAGRAETNNQDVVKPGAQHAAGLSVLHDTFGPFVENEIAASYSSRVNLTERLRLRAGGALAYHAQALDGTKLTADEAGDPNLAGYANRTNRSGRIDFNIGLSLDGDDFYAGYAMQNLRGGAAASENDFFRNNSKVHHVIQGGYRRTVAEEVGLIFHGLFRYDRQLKETFEGQLKGVFYQRAWVGIGYRSSLAYALHVGFRMDRLKVGYAHEIPTGDAHRVGGTNELLLTWDLRPTLAAPNGVGMW